MAVQRYLWAALLLLAALLAALTGCGTNPTPGQPGAIATSTPRQQGGTVVISPTPTSCSTTPTTPATPTTTPTPIPSPPARPSPTPTRSNVPPAPLPTGKVILVSLSGQWLYAYADGELAFDNAVETGRPELPTPSGTFSVLEKLRGVYFTSPWPPGSPNYYEPTYINYALLFKAGGFFLHDAWWHVRFGPGSNVPHQLPDGSWETGSHGCIGMTIPDAKRLYDWTPVGTPVIVRN